jgi:type IV pilus assembly protein PilY1
MIRIGNLFESGGSTGVPAQVNPLPVAAADPIDLDKSGNKISCQNNYHILFTDGKTNQVQPTAIPGSVASGDEDDKIPNAADTMGTIAQVPPDQVLLNLPGGAAWPKPFKQGSPAIPNTLADVATRYWAYDLRPALKNDVPSASGKNNGDLDPAKDVAWWQHVNFNAISFGAEGTLDASNQPATIAALKAGTATWPNMTRPENPIYPRGAAAGAVAVDDLWHATVNSRGAFVLAKSPVEVSYGLASILAGIQNQRKSRAAAAFGSQTVSSTAGNNIVYEATIEPGWAGDLLKVEIDPTDGHEVQTLWQASATLAAQIAPASAADEPWMDETKRRVVTLAVDPGTLGTSSGPGAPFRFANLTANQLKSLASTNAQQQKVIAYLRGGSTYGGVPIEGTGIGEFRKRSGALGDISDAQAAIVSAPAYLDASGAPKLVRPYQDATDPGYTAWANSLIGRSTRIVAAANDGMVHIFDAGPNSAAPGGGTEVFAYIPKALFRGVAGNAATEDPTAIQALTYQDGGVPIFKHHFYVNASPRVADIDFGGADWHTIVVGGLGKGGNSYYALDLTDPAASTEANAAAKVLWEWTDPTGDLRYSYGRPVIVKVRETGYPNGRWVALVTGGYNNVSGKGKIYVLDAKTGALLRTFTTTAGAPGNPSGLAQIHAFVKDRRNQIAEQIYGGDLFGNLWRIDVSANDSYLSANPVLFAELKDGSNVGQPITTAPQIEIDIHNGIDRYVFIGTGRLLDVTDFTDPPVAQQQTMYAIRDGTLQTPEAAGLPIQPRATLQPINGDRINAIVGGAPNGWYDDLPTSPIAERVVVDVQADVNTVTYVGTQAQDDPCVISLPATLYARDYTTAASVLLDPLDASASAAIVYGIPFAEGIVGSVNVGLLGSGVQELGILVSQEIPGTKPVRIRNAVNGPGRRMSWRLLTGE